MKQILNSFISRSKMKTSTLLVAAMAMFAGTVAAAPAAEPLPAAVVEAIAVLTRGTEDVGCGGYCNGGYAAWICYGNTQCYGCGCK
jgi:hypothetical protein